MISQSLLLQLTRLVARSNNILLASHANCGDATGSVVACYLALTRLGKKVTPCLPAPVPRSFSFLPKTELIITDLKNINLVDFDLLLCVDAGEPAMTGLGDKIINRPADLTIVDFDHHLTNPGYGDLNIIDKGSGATCTMLYEWFQFAGFEVDRKISTALLTGILTDTGTFANPATNEHSLQIAGHLLLQGASVKKVLDAVVNNKSLAELKLWGKAFERLREHPTLGLVSTVITQADLVELKVSNEAIEGVANFLNDLSGYRAVLVLKEQSDGTIKGSLRTTREDVDVSAMAKMFGGGGHRKAAGFTVKGSLVETEQGWLIS